MKPTQTRAISLLSLAFVRHDGIMCEDSSFFGMLFGMQTGSVYALAGSILFSGYIIYDTYMIAERLDP